MKKLVIIIAMLMVMMMTLTACGGEVTKVTHFGVGDSYQLSDGTWIVFGSNGAVEIGR